MSRPTTAEGMTVVWSRSSRGAGATPATAGPRAEPPGGPALAILDALDVGVFVADAAFTVVHTNPRAVATLRRHGEDLRRTFGLGPDQVLGASLLRLHPDPRSLEREQLPHTDEVTLGDATFRVQVNRFSDASGPGYVVTWEDVAPLRAAQRRSEALVERLGETQDVSSSMQTVAAAIEEMAASASEIARNAAEANTTVSAAVTVVGSANQTMTELGAASEQISDVVKAIGAVAEQTNLLALNATIEAARAGESGKGFAVVAGEVKELSKQTKEATERINAMITSVQHLSRAAIEAIGGLAEVMEQVSQNQASIASAVEQQTATTQEISSSVAHAARRAQEIATFVAGHR